MTIALAALEHAAGILNINRKEKISSEEAGRIAKYLRAHYGYNLPVKDIICQWNTRTFNEVPQVRREEVNALAAQCHQYAEPFLCDPWAVAFQKLCDDKKIPFRPLFIHLKNARPGEYRLKDSKGEPFGFANHFATLINDQNNAFFVYDNLNVTGVPLSDFIENINFYFSRPGDVWVDPVEEKGEEAIAPIEEKIAAGSIYIAVQKAAKFVSYGNLNPNNLILKDSQVFALPYLLGFFPRSAF